MYYTVTQPANPAYLAKCYSLHELVMVLWDNGCFVTQQCRFDMQALLAEGNKVINFNGFVIEVC